MPARRCAADHGLETSCLHTEKVVHTDDFGQVVFTIEALPGHSIQLTKYMVYHTSKTASAEELCGRAEWTLDRVTAQGFQQLLTSQEQYMDDFWRRSDVRIRDVREDHTNRSTVEIQQAIRFNLFHMLQASARAEDAGVPAKGLTGKAYEGHYFWDTEIYLLPFLTYTSPRIARNLLTFRYKMLPHARARAKQLGHRGAMFPWRTISGEEASAYYAAGTAQYHINADIMYALRKYVQATGDESFLRDCDRSQVRILSGAPVQSSFFAKPTHRRLQRDVFRSVADLKTAINRFVAETNANPKPFVWAADPRRVLAAIKRGKQALESVH